MKLTDQQLATAIKYLSLKRANFYKSLSEHEMDDEQTTHINGEIDALNSVIGQLEAEREARRIGAPA